MIDFPSSPASGQLFTAPNGVIYQWNGTLWLTNSAGGTGAVQAAAGTFTPATGADAVINFPTVMQGNSGNWLNLVNGRYTPPPGRYFIQCTNGVQAPSGGNGTWTLAPRKNGVRIPNEGAVGSGGPLFSIPLTVGIYVDANGTDYFDWVANCASAGMNAQGGQFTAFPLSGLQGPPGPLPGTVGDFCAYSSSATIPGATAVVIPSTILSGNSGNWYSTSTGRYTPPAGRYFIRASFYVPSASAAVGLQLNIRKNGVNIPGAYGGQVPGTAGWWADPAQAVIVDANGTDYFDMTAYAGPAQTGAIQFMAFNIAGVVGPPGPPGPPGNPGVGDFQAFAANAGSSTSMITVVFPTILTGNSGSYYNPANGRFTPPAGRYLLTACVSGYSSAAAVQISLYIRKNGANAAPNNPTASSAGANYYLAPINALILDANGTDYFDVAYNSTLALSASIAWFSATPLNGLIGPPGPPGPGGPLQIGTGMVSDFAGDTAPLGWYLCDGAAKDTTTDAPLFAVIGYKYGGSGTSFNLPDCRGRVTAGPDPTNVRLGNGPAGGFANNGAVLGAASGEKAHTLSLAEAPSHSHTTATAAGNFLTTAGGAGVGWGGGNTMGQDQISSAGGGGAHNVVQPTLIMNKIIKA